MALPFSLIPTGTTPGTTTSLVPGDHPRDHPPEIRTIAGGDHTGDHPGPPRCTWSPVPPSLIGGPGDVPADGQPSEPHEPPFALPMVLDRSTWNIHSSNRGTDTVHTSTTTRRADSDPHVATKRTYTEDERRQAVALYETDGPTAVERELGIPKGTVTGWAQDQGVGTVRNERTAAATEAVMADAAARRAAMSSKLLTIAEKAIERELELIERSDLRDTVGARTRAIHDHQLLEGKATGRTEHTATPERKAHLEDELARRRAARAA